MNPLIRDILNVSRTAPTRCAGSILNKLTEEVGEVATMINKPTKQFDEPLAGEIADCINALVDLLYVELERQNPDLSEVEVMNLAEMQLEEWSSKKVRKWRDIYVQYHGEKDV